MLVRSRLNEFRREKGLSLRKLGTQTDIPFSYICEFEGGIRIPSDFQLDKICDALGVTPEEIYPDYCTRKALEE